MPSKKQRLDEFLEHARKALEKHEVLSKMSCPKGGGWWTVGRPGSSTYWVVVVVTPDNSLIVHGDVDIVCFSRYHVPGATCLDVLNWIADKDLRSATSKASVGTGRSACYEVDAEVAAFEARALISSYPEHADTLERAASRFEDEDVDRVREYVYEQTGDPDLADLGRVPSHRVMWAWAICRKLQELLRLTDGTPTP